MTVCAVQFVVHEDSRGMRGRLPLLRNLFMKTLFLVRPFFSPCQAVLPLAISALCSANLSAETAQPPLNSTAMTALNNVVVTATRTPQDANTALAQIAIITRADIEAAGNLNLTELLQRKAQVEIRATGGAGQPSGVFIRGANSQHTLVLVDGLRLGSSTAGGAAFENIPLDLIERIEIVKGPLSGVYGSDAIGGVIQIFTRNADKPRLTLSLSLGSNAERAVSAGFTTLFGSTGPRIATI